ncbi:MAG: light-harvesting antenna LH1, beta subunit [Pseudomonadota bacterium]
MASDTPAGSESMSGLTRTEAQEFHKAFVFSFIIFTLIAVVAHFLVWMWRPWIPGPEGYSALEEGIRFAGSLPGLFG